MTRFSLLMQDLNSCTDYCLYSVSMDTLDDDISISLQFSNIQKRLCFEIKYQLKDMTDYPYHDLKHDITMSGHDSNQNQKMLDYLKAEMSVVDNNLQRFRIICSIIGKFDDMV